MAKSSADGMAKGSDLISYSNLYVE